MNAAHVGVGQTACQCAGQTQMQDSSVWHAVSDCESTSEEVCTQHLANPDSAEVKNHKSYIDLYRNYNMHKDGTHC